MRAVPQLTARGASQMSGNVCVTNVPGSQVPLYLCGARMDAYYGLGPVYDYAGPIHLVVSYVGWIHLSVTASREAVPDVADYVARLERSLGELAEATGR
jgi:hypothetical protein